ncbi:hypothetical protein [Limosilactobacillus reuteri]|uniref:hypothetical protein n=1 Tax=Limosilactobacillus reuteri TaxID=1598 RepID=UPI000A2D179C|nr:hypothetical protein [Limosilactobacillus reuteri]OTA46158.1 hypothetical protein BHL74_00630 [Limosilactobacillus reuteri]
MKIAFVQPTEASLINRDFWYVVNTDNPLEYETFIESTALMKCEYDLFDTIKKAEDYLDGIQATEFYKKRMRKELDKIKDDVRIFNWAVA